MKLNTTLEREGMQLYACVVVRGVTQQSLSCFTAIPLTKLDLTCEGTAVVPVHSTTTAAQVESTGAT